MNYTPLCGYWFYGAASATKRASYYCSWGLLGDAPAPSVGDYYSLPTIPYIPSIPIVGRYF
jgi:hypothetical protein